MKRALIAGTSGIGRLMMEHLLQTGEYRVVAFTEKDPSLFGTECLGVPVIGEDKAAIDLWTKKEIDCAFLGLGETSLRVRARVYELFENAGIPLPSFVHPTAVLAPSAKIGAGTVMMPLSSLEHNVTLGKNVYVGSFVLVGHDSIVGDHSYIAPGTVVGGASEIDQCVMLGINSTLFPRTKIGANARIGLGAVVRGQIAPDDTLVAPLATRLVEKKR